jgi:hypothetical protein
VGRPCGDDQLAQTTRDDISQRKGAMRVTAAVLYDAKTPRLGARNVPMPYNDKFELATIPSRDDITAAIRSVLEPESSPPVAGYERVTEFLPLSPPWGLFVLDRALYLGRDIRRNARHTPSAATFPRKRARRPRGRIGPADPGRPAPGHRRGPPPGSARPGRRDRARDAGRSPRAGQGRPHAGRWAGSCRGLPPHDQVTRPRLSSGKAWHPASPDDRGQVSKSNISRRTPTVVSGYPPRSDVTL